MIELDGSYGEGGGALVRVALALSTLTGQPFHVTNIRTGREQAGLKAQHLAAIIALKKICQAQTNEIQLGSTELSFQPGKIKSGRYEFDIGTAGSITLFLQAIIIPCLFAPDKITLTIKGGTSGKWQASVDYLQQMLLPQLRRFVSRIEIKIFKRGYYPAGGGEIILKIAPKYPLKNLSIPELLSTLSQKVSSINLQDQGKLEQIRGIIAVSQELEEKGVAQRIKQTSESLLRKYNIPLSLRTEYTKTLSVGGECVLWAIYSHNGKIDEHNPIIIGADALLEKNKSSEDVAKEAVDELISILDSDACLDEHLLDQLLPFMALLPGSKIMVKNLTPHAQTNIYVIEKFLAVQFIIQEQRGGIMIECKKIE